MAAVRGRLSGLPGYPYRSVFHPAYSRHPFVWKQKDVGLIR